MMFVFNWTGFVDSRPLVLLDLYRQIRGDEAHGSIHILQGMLTEHPSTNTRHAPQMNASRPLHPARPLPCVIVHVEQLIKNS